MIGIGVTSFSCSTQLSPFDEECKRAKIIALLSSIVVSFSVVMTIMNMNLTIQGRRLEQYHEELQYDELIND